MWGQPPSAVQPRSGPKPPVAWNFKSPSAYLHLEGRMFCIRCGTEMPPQSSSCPRCGRSLGDPVRAVAQSRLERHLQTLGILWMAIGGLFLIPAVLLMVFGRTAHFLIHDRDPLPTVFPLLLYIAGGTLVILAAGGVCVGLGLIQRQPWARIVAIILAALALFHPPFGTALGIYTLWVLLADDHGDEYRYLSRSA